MRYESYRFRKTISLAVALSLAIGLAVAILLPATALAGRPHRDNFQVGIRVDVRPVGPIVVGQIPGVYLVQSQGTWTFVPRYGWVYSPTYYRDYRPYNYAPYGNRRYYDYTPYDYLPHDYIPNDYSPYSRRYYRPERPRYYSPSRSYNIEPPFRGDRNNKSERIEHERMKQR